MSVNVPDGGPSPAARPLRAALYRILEALARISLRHGVPFDEFADLAKRAFVTVAHREWRIEGRKQSASRVAVLTGIHRKDVGRVLATHSPEDRESLDRLAYAARVITGWHRDRRFTQTSGRPARLGFDEGRPSFVDLVKRYGGGDVPPRAVLDELERVGAVERSRDGRLRLLARAYVPSTASPESLEILGSDVSDLLRAIDHNLVHPAGEGFFQRKTAYDNLPDDAIEQIHRRVRSEGQGFLEAMDRQLARRDRDSNPKATGTGHKRAMVGVYFFAEDVTPPEESDE